MIIYEIKELLAAVDVINAFNRMNLDDVAFLWDGKRVEISQKAIDAWGLTGLNNRDFVLVNIVNKEMMSFSEWVMVTDDKLTPWTTANCGKCSKSKGAGVAGNWRLCDCQIERQILEAACFSNGGVCPLVAAEGGYPGGHCQEIVRKLSYKLWQV